MDLLYCASKLSEAVFTLKEGCMLKQEYLILPLYFPNSIKMKLIIFVLKPSFEM